MSRPRRRAPGQRAQPRPGPTRGRRLLAGSASSASWAQRLLLLTGLLSAALACGEEPVEAPAPITVAPPEPTDRPDGAVAGLPVWIEAPAGLDAEGRLLAVGFGAGATSAPATLAAADRRARLELARAALPVVERLLADLQQRYPVVGPELERPDPDPRPGAVAEAVSDAARLGRRHDLPAQGLIYRQAGLSAEQLAACYRGVLEPWLTAARDGGRLPRACWEAGLEHLAAVPDLLTPASGESR